MTPGDVDVEAATDAFLAGRVLVSCGLLATIRIDGKHGPGDIVPGGAGHDVVVDVRHPSWIHGDRCALYRNGRLVEEADGDSLRMKAEPLSHDAWFVAVSQGRELRHPSWPIAKPYQPDSPEWTARPFACTGAVFVDADGDGEWTSPKQYAERVVKAAKGDPADVVAGLAEYDEAVAAQAASLLHVAGFDPLSPRYRELVRDAPRPVRTGFEEYAAAWRACLLATMSE